MISEWDGNRSVALKQKIMHHQRKVFKKGGKKLKKYLSQDHCKYNEKWAKFPKLLVDGWIGGWVDKWVRGN